MARTSRLLSTATIALMVIAFACDESSDAPDTANEAGVPPANDESEHWRLIITRADGTVETIPSADRPIICGSEEGPKVLLFCGRGTVTLNGNPAPAWDFLPVNVEAGDTYAIETPAGLTPEPTPTTSTPTVAEP